MRYILVMSCCAFMLAVGLPAYAQDRPNIILIVADDHGTDAIGAYGNSVIRTPAIDELAEKGTVFTRAHATVSSCSPSRSVLLTGLHNHANGMYGLEHWEHHFSSFDSVKSLPVLISEAGYKTARVGKYHIAPESVYDFDLVLSEGAANDMQSMARSPVEMAQKSKAFIKESKDPFFLYYATDDPHRAFPFDTGLKPNKFGNRPESYPGIKEVTYDPENVLVPPFLPDLPEVRAEVAEYYQSVSRVDQGVAALIKILEESGKSDNTIIFYLSDNGIAFPGAKTNLYQSGINLPLIVLDPRAKENGKTDLLVSWTDITPTILDYADIDTVSTEFQGLSIKDHVRDRKTIPRKAIYGSHTFHEVHMYYPMRMVRTDRYKLIQNFAHKFDFPFALDLEQSPTWKAFLKTDRDKFAGRPVENFLKRPQFELYDLKEDPQELNNLAYNPDYTEIKDDLTIQIHSFMRETDDPWHMLLDD